MKKIIFPLIISLIFTGCSLKTEPIADESPSVLSKEADAFFQLVKENKATEAYNFTGKSFKEKVTQEDFNNFIPTIAPTDFKKIEWEREEFDLKYGYLDGKITYKDESKMPIEMNFEKEEDGKWHLLYVGFSVEDIPVLPTDEEAKVIVHKTISEFVDAVEKEDFTNFYSKEAATLWQKQTSPEELKNSFTSFFSTKEALKEVKKIKPEISTSELKEQNTSWQVKGQFKAKRYTLDFDFEYLLQDGKMKLFALDISAK